MTELRLYPDPCLRQAAREISDEEFERGDADGVSLLELHQAMGLIMSTHGGIGLAAPQVGVGLRMFVIQTQAGIETVCNPRVLDKEDPQVKEEGCLSIPWVIAPIERAQKVTIAGMNSRGEKITLRLEGMEAVAVQHEADHLDGTLFLDLLDAPYEEELKKAWKLGKDDDPIATFVKQRRRIAWRRGGDSSLLSLSPLFVEVHYGDEARREYLGGKRKKNQKRRPKKRRKK